VIHASRDDVMTVIVKFLSLLLYSICQIDKKKQRKNKEKNKAKKKKINKT
jgi:Na+-transporting methylmalonyl-CoA/oxaloacetate decarboxylase gamma subunit